MTPPPHVATLLGLTRDEPRRPLGGVEGLRVAPQARVYRLDTIDGVDLIYLCANGHAGLRTCLAPGEDVRAAADRLLKAGCETCRMVEDARHRAIGVLVLAAAPQGGLVEVICHAS